MLIAFREKPQTFLPATLFADNVPLEKHRITRVVDGKEIDVDCYQKDWRFVLLDSKDINRAWREFEQIIPKLRPGKMIELTTSHGTGQSNRIYYITGIGKAA